MPYGGFKIDVLGLDEVQKAFDVLPLKIQAKVLRPALRAGAHILRTAAIRSAPRFTGRMADFIQIRAMARRQGRVGFLVMTGTKAELGIPERTRGGHPRGYYPVAIEYGWHPRNTPATRLVTGVRQRNSRGRKGDAFEVYRRLSRSELGTSKIPANPWMRRAFDGAQSAAIDAIRAEVVRRMNDLERTVTDDDAPGRKAA